ncbi:MAG TPA: hypothetical protein DHV36_24135 [Desulfobacteraceae bacterium]|nr:hypothetical protein [Desulfobacteraceae bacterium]
MECKPYFPDMRLGDMGRKTTDLNQKLVLSKGDDGCILGAKGLFFTFIHDVVTTPIRLSFKDN